MRVRQRAGSAIASFLLAASAAISGCGPSTYNVRASRAYSNEDANPAIITDRLADLDGAVALADELLSATPYSPEDAWVQALRLDNDEGDKLREHYADRPPYSGEYEVPIAKLYRAKIEEVLSRARAPRAEVARHSSLLDATASLAPGAKDLKEHWEDLVRSKRSFIAEQQRIVELSRSRSLGAPDTPTLRAARAKVASIEKDVARAKDRIRVAADALRVPSTALTEHAAIARDALNALSFVLRMHIEALAVAPYIVKQSRRLARSDDRGFARSTARAEALRDLIDEERAALETLTEALTAPAGMSLSDAAGYEMHEGLFSQAAEVNLDSTHIKLKGDVDVLFFHAIESATASGAVSDYTGRTRRLAYDFDPVFMIGGRAILSFDFLHVKNAASLNAGFKTDRLFSVGGEIKYDNSLGELLGLDGFASDLVDMGADLLGFSTSVKLATFTSGRVSEVVLDRSTGRDTDVLAEAPLQLKYHQVDVGFDTTRLFPDTAEALYIESLLVGFRYMDYSLPRIFYELRERDPGTGDYYVLDRQSPPQSVESVFYQGGFTIRLGNGEWPRLSPFGDLGIYGGAGPVHYYFTPDPTTPGGTRDAHQATMIAVTGNASFGLRLRLTSYRSRPRLVTELSYNAEVIGQGIVSSIRETKQGDKTIYTVNKKLDLGGFDVFHGPRFLAVMVF